MTEPTRQVDAKFTARCSCGQLSVAIRGDPVRASVCHCIACQLRTGSAFGAQARFKSDDVIIHGSATLYTRKGDSGDSVAFSFCPNCGSTVYYKFPNHPEMIGIPLGALAGQQTPSPTAEFYDSRKLHWVDIKSISEH